MLFNSGFLANQAVLKNLPGDKDLVLVDKLIHHSIAQALLQGKARFKRYDHLNLDQLEELLVKNKGKYETIFVVTESVFSMSSPHPHCRLGTGHAENPNSSCIVNVHPRGKIW